MDKENKEEFNPFNDLEEITSVGPENEQTDRSKGGVPKDSIDNVNFSG